MHEPAVWPTLAQTHKNSWFNPWTRPPPKPGQVDEPDVWSALAGAQLEHGAVTEAIASYLRGADDSRCADVIERAEEVRLCRG